MKAWEIVGWYSPGACDIFCVECCPEDPGPSPLDEPSAPIFAVSEDAIESTCGECGEPLLCSD